MNKKAFDWSVYLLTDQHTANGRPLLEVVQAAIHGGATAIQLRAKEMSTREMFQFGQALHKMTQAAGLPLIINDRLDLALALEAEGVHVGQNDLPASLVRCLLGPNRILGVTAETIAQAQQAEQEGADYLGSATVYPTFSKADAPKPIGVVALAAVVQAVKIPVVAIGGITLANAAAPIEAGAAGVAVISAIIGAVDPEIATQTLAKVVKQTKLSRINSL